MQKYYVEDDDRVFDDIDEVINHCIDEDYHKDDDYFEEWVNDRYEYIEIYGERYWAYDILNSMADGELESLNDDYCEDQNENDRDNARYELRNADTGATIYIQNYTIKVIWEEDEDEDGDDVIVCNSIEELRAKLKEEEKLKVDQAIEIHKTETDLMKMFQIVGE